MNLVLEVELMCGVKIYLSKTSCKNAGGWRICRTLRYYLL